MLLLVLAATWVSAILIAPLIDSRAIYTFFSTICHQVAERSWFLAGEPLAACIRCTSVYVGFLSGLVLRIPPDKRLLRASVALLLLEVCVAHFWMDFEIARALSGILVGAGAAGFVSEGIQGLILERTGYRHFPPTTETGELLEHL